MLKFLFTILIGFTCHVCFAEIENTSYYIAYDWFDVYPEGYLLNEDISVPLYKAPDNFEELGYCELKKGRTFHQMSHLNEDDTFAIITGIKTYVATKPVEVYEGEVAYPKHSIVHQLTYLNEGVCHVMFNDKIVEDICPQDLDGLQLLNASPLQEKRMIKTTCDDNQAGWILESDLIEQTHPNIDGTTSVIILTEEEFIERGWLKID